MFDRFLQFFPVSDGPAIVVNSPISTLGDWLDLAGGHSFRDGLYRVHTRESAAAANDVVRAAYPEFASRVFCFGFDWLGRQFALDTGRGAQGDPEVLLLEPGTGEALEIPVGFSQFHDYGLVDSPEPALAESFFAAWREAGGASPKFSECIGYKKPLFLGGKDDISNLEVSDLDVYWSIMGQLRVQVKGLPVGTPVSGVNIS